MRGVSRDSLAKALAEADRLVAESGPDALRSIAGELFTIVHLLSTEARLRRVVSDPGVAADQRAALLSDVLGARVSQRALQVAEVLVRSQWSTPRDLLDATDEVAANVLFAAEESDGTLDEVEDELFRFARILEREPELRSALTDPSLPAERKQSLLDALLGGKVRPATEALVLEVTLHERGRTIDRGLEEYGRLAAARRDRLVARVTSAVPLSDAQLTRLASTLATQLGHQVHLNLEIDEALVGGITVRVGDELYDGSIAHRIALARRLMTG
jgi:F-type H+-transporting ATPase subunit delta